MQRNPANIKHSPYDKNNIRPLLRAEIRVKATKVQDSEPASKRC